MMAFHYFFNEEIFSNEQFESLLNDNELYEKTKMEFIYTSMVIMTKVKNLVFTYIQSFGLFL